MNLIAILFLLLYPAPRDPEPDPLGKGFVGVQLTENGGAVIVTRIVPNSPADKSGLKENDELLKIDGAGFNSVTEAADFIRRCRPGNVVALEVKRGEKAMTLRLKVGARPADLP